MSDFSKNRVGHDGVASTPTTYQVGYLKVYSNGIEHDGEGDATEYDITNLLAYFEINESLNSSALEVILAIGDSVNITEALNLQGSERLELLVHRKEPSGSRASERKSFTLKLRIAEIFNYVRAKPGLVTYNIRAVSDHVYINSLKKLRRSFHGSPTDLIRQICKSDLLISKNDSDLEDASSKNIIKGIYPNIRPMQSIAWLIKLAFDQGTPYFCYQTVNGSGSLRLKSYKQLLAEDPHDFKYKLVPFADTTVELETREGYLYEKGLIRDVTSEYGQSKLMSAMNGAYASTLHTIDISNKKYNKNLFNYNNSDMMKLNKNKSFAETDNSDISGFNLTDSIDSKHYFVSLNSKAFGVNNGNYSSPAPIDLAKSMAHLEHLQYQTHKIQIAGNFDIKVGDKIQIEIRKVHDNKKGAGIDKLQSGVYMITEINHRFKDGFYQDLIIQKDSSEVDLDATK